MTKLRTVRTDPFASSDLARDCGLTAHQAWTLHLAPIQAEYRSAEWSGTLTDFAAATRIGRKAQRKDVDVPIAKGLFEEIMSASFACRLWAVRDLGHPDRETMRTIGVLSTPRVRANAMVGAVIRSPARR